MATSPSTATMGHPELHKVTSMLNTWDAIEPNTAILIHIHQTLKEEPSLRTTIIAIGGIATLAWSLDQGIIVDFGKYFYL